MSLTQRVARLEAKVADPARVPWAPGARCPACGGIQRWDWGRGPFVGGAALDEMLADQEAGGRTCFCGADFSGLLPPAEVDRQIKELELQ